MALCSLRPCRSRPLVGTGLLLLAGWLVGVTGPESFAGDAERQSETSRAFASVAPLHQGRRALTGRGGVARRQAPRTSGDAGATPVIDPVEERRQILQLLSKYRADDASAWGQLAFTALLWVSALCILHFSGGHCGAVIFMALCSLRCFMTFHDAAHLSFFEDAGSNRNLARVIQFFSGYSWKEWDVVHNPHHAHFGDPNVKDSSLTIFFSQQELREAPWYLRLVHRIARDPIPFYPFAGLWIFFMNKPMRHAPFRWTMPLLLWLGLGSHTALMYLAAAWLAGSIGVACFHLQHHCNTPYRVAGPAERTHADAALEGSTRMPILFPFSLFSFGIEYHHIHHFDVRVPGYNLAACDAEGKTLGLWDRANTIGTWRAFKSLFHTQFEGSRKFRDADGNPPRFVSFWPYSAIGLQDAQLGLSTARRSIEEGA